MSDIGTMVSELISAGCSPEVAAKVVTEAVLFGIVSGGSRVDAATEKRRAWDREYRRNKRTIPPDSTRFHPTSENASLSKEERIEDKKESKRETTRGSRLPVGWTPTPQDWVVACELLSEPRANSELEKFTDHWKQQPGSKGVKLDWEAAWRNWVRRAAEYGGNRNGKVQDNPRSGSLIAALDRALEQSKNADLAAAENPVLRISGRSV